LSFRYPGEFRRSTGPVEPAFQTSEPDPLHETPRKVGFLVKKFVAILLMGVVLFSGAVGCSGDTPAGKDKDKAKDAHPLMHLFKI